MIEKKEQAARSLARAILRVEIEKFNQKQGEKK